MQGLADMTGKAGIGLDEEKSITALSRALGRAADGDKEAFDAVVSACGAKAHSIARYYVGAGGDAEDVVQEVWLRLWENRACLASVGNFDAWLFRVVKYRSIEYLRGKSAQKRKDVPISVEENLGLIDALLLCGDGPEEIVLRKEQRRVLLACVRGLKEIYSLPLTLYYGDGMSLGEIALLLDLSAAAVKWRLYMGRQLLKKALLKEAYFNDKKTGGQYVAQDPVARGCRNDDRAT